MDRLRRRLRKHSRVKYGHGRQTRRTILVNSDSFDKRSLKGLTTTTEPSISGGLLAVKTNTKSQHREVENLQSLSLVVNEKRC